MLFTLTAFFHKTSGSNFRRRDPGTCSQRKWVGVGGWETGGHERKEQLETTKPRTKTITTRQMPRVHHDEREREGEE